MKDLSWKREPVVAESADGLRRDVNELLVRLIALITAVERRLKKEGGGHAGRSRAEVRPAFRILRSALNHGLDR